MKTARISQHEQQPMNPTSPILETDTASQLLKLASDIETYRVDLGLTKAALLRANDALGTDRTYNKLTSGDTSQLDIAAWLERYKRAWDRLMQEDVYQEMALLQLTGPAELCAAYLQTRNRRDNSRFGLLLGENGTGKTSAINVLRSKSYAANSILTEAYAIWKNERTNEGTAVPLLESIGAAMGMVGLPARKNKLMSHMVNELRQSRRCILIEEGHHLCPQGLGTIKNLISLTPTTIIVTAIPKLWEQMTGTKDAYREAKQLTGNRLAFVVELSPEPSDIQAMMENGGITFSVMKPSSHQPSEMERAVGIVRAKMASHGNLKFVKHCISRFSASVKSGESPDLDAWDKAVQQTSDSLTPKRRR